MTACSTVDALRARIFGEELPMPAASSEELNEAYRTIKEELRSKFKVGAWVVHFTKVNGESAVMECTLDAKLIPPWEDSDSETAGQRVEKDMVLPVYALDRGGWRSFRVPNVNLIYKKPEAL